MPGICESVRSRPARNGGFFILRYTRPGNFFDNTEAEMAKPDEVPTIRELERILASAKVQQHLLGESISDRRGKIRTLADEQAGDEKDLRRVKHRIMETTNRLFARSVLRPELLAARAAYLAKLQLSQSEQITVAEQRRLEQEIRQDLGALQQLCTHPFAFSYDGYGGSRSWDYDDAYHGHRVCTLCNRRETSISTSEDKYSVLVEDGTRLIRRDLRNEKDRLGAEWFPIEFLQQLFEASAGDINIRWPKEKQKQS